MAARRNNEGNSALAEQRGDRPHIFAFQVHVEDGEIEPSFLDMIPDRDR
jgi:hypothetical protein